MFYFEEFSHDSFYQDIYGPHVPYCISYAFEVDPLSPGRRHSKNAYLSSMGMLGTEPVCFPTQQPLL